MASSNKERRVMESSLSALLARANHLLTEGFHKELREHGLSATEWRVLAALSERDGMTMTELAKLLLFKQPTLTKAVDRMEHQHLVQRHTPPHDRRRTEVFVTETGRRVVMPLLARAREHERALRNVYGEAASRALEAALQALIDRLSQRARWGTTRDTDRASPSNLRA